MMPWPQLDWKDNAVDANGSNRYVTAQGEALAANRVEPDRFGAQHNIPPFRSPLENMKAAGVAGDTSSLSDRDRPASSLRSGQPLPSPNQGGGMGSEDIHVRQDDWEAVHSSRGSPHSSGSDSARRRQAKSENEAGDRQKEHIDRHIGKDEELENRADAEAAKQCYFDLELGEAGPASIGTDASSGRERRWHRFRSGATYDGEWLGGIRDGIGKQCWPDGTVYVGEWRRGRAGGRGEIRHCDGDIFTGEWINGRAHGQGVFRHQGSHAIYEGEFRCDMREGQGVELWVDGSWYAGEFRKGAKHGHGEHRWPMPSGTYYVGGWRANELAGPGRYFVKDGPSYQGQWINSVIDGAGVYTWVDGQQFEGQYQLDRKHGFGILTTPDGESKERFWDMGVITDRDPTES